jgi:ubiquinone/menaquinone biosynthesis C-methylase UbiE
VSNRELNEMDKVRHYEATRYRGLDQRLIHAREHKMVINYIRKRCRSGQHVLDLPVGYGRFVPALLEQGVKVTGVDLNPKMLQRTQERFGEGVVVREGRADNIPFPSNHFDGVISVRLFQHIHDSAERQKAFSEMKRVCTGWAVITLYLSTLTHICARRLRRGKRLVMLQFSEVEKELNRAGWVVQDKKSILPGLHAQSIVLLNAI